MIGGKSLVHNDESVINYRSKNWYLIPFPETKGAPYVADNLATASNSSFRADPEFQLAISASESRWVSSGMKRDISWRLHVGLFSARLALDSAREGSHFVELGAGRGFMAAGILSALGNEALAAKRVIFHLMDTFRSDWQGENSRKALTSKPQYYADGPEEVVEYFSSFSQVKIVEGQLPHTLKSLPADGKVAFLHVDLNSAQSESACLQELAPRLGSRSVILFDDSTNPGCDEQLKVHRQFARDMGSTLLELPTGQALLVLS